MRYFAERLEELRSKNHDWTIWDELYDYARGTSPNFASSNFTRDALDALQIQSLVLVDKNKKILTAVYADPLRDDLQNVPELFSELSSLVGVFSADDLNRESFGLFSVSGRPMLIAARSIMKSDSSGPAAGTLYFGIDVDASFIGRVKHAIGIDVSMLADSSSDALLEANKGVKGPKVHYLEADSHPALFVTREESKSQVYLKLLQGDFDNKAKLDGNSKDPALRLMLEYPRDIMLLGAQVASIVNWMVLGLSLASWILFYILLRIVFINRITAVQATIGAFDTTDENLVELLKRNYSVRSKNEIDKLGGAFVQVLERTISAEALRDKVRADMMHSAKLASLGEMAGALPMKSIIH